MALSMSEELRHCCGEEKEKTSRGEYSNKEHKQDYCGAKNRGGGSRGTQALLVLPKIQCIVQEERPGLRASLFTFGTFL